MILFALRLPSDANLVSAGLYLGEMFVWFGPKMFHINPLWER